MDTGNKDLKACIQPLGSGTYDVGAVLTKLSRLGWHGPIGLQHFGIKGDAKANLQSSMDAWRVLSHKAWPPAASPQTK
jgi:hypothetical protein